MNTTEQMTLPLIALPETFAAFRPEERLAPDNGRLTPGQVALANESRFNASFYSEPLTAYAVGWRDQNHIEETLDFLFPPVQAGRRFEFKKADNAEAFYSETDDQRAIGITIGLAAQF